MSRNHEAARRHDLLTQAFDARSVRLMEQPLLNDGVPLVDIATAALTRVVASMLSESGVSPADSHVVVLAGGGSNGADGLGVAARLASHGADATVVATDTRLDETALTNFAAVGRGGLLVLDPQARIPGTSGGFGPGEAGERLKAAIDLIAQADLVVDAITGIGGRGGLRGIPATLVEAVSAMYSQDDAVGLPLVVAADIPSGLGVDDGEVPGPLLQTDVTVCLGALKPCMLLPPACNVVGSVELVDLGFDLSEAVPSVELIGADLATQVMRVPESNDSKYSRGVVGMATGSRRYPGAAVLSVGAAQRSGIGMVRYIGPDPARQLVLAGHPEVVLGKGRVQSWVVGCGVDATKEGGESQDPKTNFITALLDHYRLDDDADDPDDAATETATQLTDGARNSSAGLPPICVDAGALELLPEHVPHHVVITPHAGELARLLQRLGEQVVRADVLAAPLHWALRAHELIGATVLLKGSTTIVVGDDEDQGTRVLVSKSAPAWLATAGAGDVLAGILGAFLAQQDDGAWDDDAALPVDVAASAAYVHGCAATIAANGGLTGAVDIHLLGSDAHADDVNTSPGSVQSQSIGRPIVASDVIAAIPDAIEGILK